MKTKMMMRYWLISLFVLGVVGVYAQEEDWTGVSVDFSHGKLQVSKNGRFLQHKDGTPFFYLGDTAWELFHRLNVEDVEKYLENRRAKGFTVIQAVVLAELDGLNTPAMNGEVPLKDIPEVIPNETYFKWVDKVIRIAEAKGLYVGLLPTWGDKVDKQWGVGPQIFNPAYAQAYGVWLGKRYKNFKNIIWINGGDRWGGDSNYAIWNALAKGIKSTDKNHLMTYHPVGECSSAQWFHDSDWLGFNMVQTGHCQRNYEIYERLIVKDYNRYPVKPCMDGEPRYENHPVCWKPDSLGWFDDTDVRQAMYWSLFSGSFGHTYGCHDIWQMKTKDRKAEGFARGEWSSSLDLPGAFDLIHARRLMERFDWESRVPANEIIVSENTSYDNKVVALRGNGFAFVYFPNGEKATLDFRNVSKQDSLIAEWMNPQTGELTQAANLPREQEHSIAPPSSGRGNDWILIVRE